MIVVYDVLSGESFINVKRWLQEIDHNCDTVNRILGEYQQPCCTAGSVGVVSHRDLKHPEIPCYATCFYGVL